MNETGADPASQTFSLARDGAPPLRFRGRLKASASNEHLDLPAWSELRLYEKAKAGLIVEVAAIRGALGLPDLRDARPVPDLEAALDAIETFDPTRIDALPAVIATRAPSSRLIGSVALRIRLARLREEHAILVEKTAEAWGCPPARSSLAAVIAAQQAASAARAIQAPRGL